MNMKNEISKFIKKLSTTERAPALRKHRIMGELITHIASLKRVRLFYKNPANTHALSVIKKVKKETEMLLNDLQAYQIYMAVTKTEKIKGDIAEVGVYKGGSAKLICEMTKKKTVHLFDTFEGLPDLSPQDSEEQFQKGEYSAQLDYVKKVLKNYTHIQFYKGFFPSTAEPVKNKMFSFVHLDVDIYKSTLSSLAFFYFRMSRGGIIISHDYPSSKGVKKAFDEFYQDKPEHIIELPLCDQCIVIKL